MIWVAVGGRGTLAGAALGALVVNCGQDLVHRRAAGALAVRARRACSSSSRCSCPRAFSARREELVGAAARAQVRRRSSPADAGAAPTGGVDAMISCPSPRPCSISTTSRSSFDGFRALNALSLAVDHARDARHHRPQRRRQDDHDGRHHRQDAARTTATALFEGTHDLTSLDEADDRRSSASAASSRRRPCSRCTRSRTTCGSR